MTAFGSFRRARVAALVLTAIFGSACSERSPEIAAPRRIDVPSDMPNASVTIVTGALEAVGDTLTTTFAIDPAISAAYKIGDEHYLWVNENGVCDRGSPYGPAFWNDRCAAKTTPTVVTARSWKDAAGRPHIEFEPALRFVPQKGKNKSSAMLFMHDVQAAYDAHSKILFCRDGRCVDEAAKYEFMETDRNKHEGFVYRPILHFSGYEVHCGIFLDF